VGVPTQWAIRFHCKFDGSLDGIIVDEKVLAERLPRARPVTKQVHQQAGVEVIQCLHVSQL
jgi:hypothetical protein